MDKIKFVEKCTVEPGRVYNMFVCEGHNWRFRVADSIYDISNKDIENKSYNLIYEWMLCHDSSCPYEGKDYLWHFYWDNKQTLSNELLPFSINVCNLFHSYPKTFMDKVDRVLINLSYKYTEYGEEITLTNTYETARLMFCDNIDVSFNPASFLDILNDLAYIKRKDPLSEKFFITASGWKHIDKLKKQKNEKKQGFVAMQFCDDTIGIREVFKNAINDSGYVAQIIDEKEHNNQIVPEIFYEIERSNFLVVDVTYPNYGAYYEAGYGQALKKEVIVCCREKEFDSQNHLEKPHFDIAQKKTIVWKDEADLYNKLIRRIEATIN